MVWNDGTKYKGAFFNAKFHGYGELHYSNGSYYKGFFEEGLRHGKKGEFFDGETKKTTVGTFV